MRNAIDFRPIAGQVTNILLLYDKGVYEIINDSPYRLSVNGIGGSVHIDACSARIFSNQRGGNAIQIQPLPSLLLDGTNNVIAPQNSSTSVMPPITVNNNIIVNEYFPEEVISTAYPVSLSRMSTNTVSRPLPYSVTFTNVAGPQTVTLLNFGGLADATTQIWIAGFDFTGQLASTSTTNHIITMNNVIIINNSIHQMQWCSATGQNYAANLSVRFAYPIPNQNNAKSITFTVDNLDNTISYNFTIWAFLE